MEDYIFNNKCLLIIGGGIETVPGVLKAKEMGLIVVVSDIDESAPSIKYSDYFLKASTYDIDETINVAVKFNNDIKKIDGVICIATDVPLTVAHVSKKLGLNSISIFSAILASDKLQMKNKFKKDNIAIPWFCGINNLEELKNCITQKGYDLVIKPVDSRGARGVIKLNKNLNLESVFLESISHSPKKQLIVEKFLTGPQLSTEAIVIDGKVYNFGFSDRNYEFLEKYAPHIIENGGDLPTFLDEKVKLDVVNLIEKAAKSIEVANGIIKGDIVIHNGKPFIIEVATRLSGGYFCSHEIPLNTGVDFLKIAILQSLNIKISKNLLKIKKNKPVIQRYIFPNLGIIKEITLDHELLKNKNIKLFELRVKIGDVIKEIKGHPARAGLVITTGKSKSEALALAERVISSINITTEESW